MMRSGLTWIGGTLFAVALAVFVTWPHALHMRTMIFSHHDPYFSIWRLAWIAHALATRPFHLFDANIFYPATTTLAYSDATLLEGLLGAPLFWTGVSPVLIYNTLMLAGFAGSALAMFVLVRYLTQATAPALVSAAIFTLAPYRIEHVMHLELQWAMWMPLTFWAMHRAIDTGARRFGALAGLFFSFQILSCVYYGIFLAMALVVFGPLLIVLSGRRGVQALPNLAIGAVVAAAMTLPFVWPYFEASRALGVRDAAEVARYSAQPMNYLSASSLNIVWGWTADRWGDREVRLFPGAIAIVLAVLSVANRAWRWSLLYFVTAIVALEFSFGTNGALYRWASGYLTPLQGFRSPSRFAMVAMAALAVLSGLGTQTLIERAPVLGRWRTALVPLLLALMFVEYANRPLPLSHEDLGTAPIYRVLRSAEPGVVMELPVATPDRLPGWDVIYGFWSISHWKPLVNGYSGYHPVDYLQTLLSMRTFPDDASIARLRAHDVRYIVVHQSYYEPKAFTDLMLRMAVRPELRSWGSYKDPVGSAELFVLEQSSR